METKSIVKRNSPICQRKHRSQNWPLNQSAEKLKLHKENIYKMKSAIVFVKLGEL